MLNGLDLFSGAGFAAQSLAPWKRTVAYCERDQKRIHILLSRMLRGEIESAPLCTDITALRGGDLRGEVDLISAGFPCTNISVAGRREGLGGSESQLFWHVVRLTQETKAPLIFLENVWPGIRKHVPIIRSAFEGLGYECRDGVLQANEVGARHKRARWFMAAYSHRESKKRIQLGRRIRSQGSKEIFFGGVMENGENPDFNCATLAQFRSEIGNGEPFPFGLGLLEGNDWDEYASFFLRMDNGRPYRSHRIGALGAGVVPIQSETAFKILTGRK